MIPGIERITEGDDGRLLALIIYANFKEEGVHFLTDPRATMQMAYMKHPDGKVIQAHVHNPVPRAVGNTEEVLLIRKGSMRADFFDDDKQYLCSRVLHQGDVILLSRGGHGFEALEELELIEVKQGPYVGERDKVRFDGIAVRDQTMDKQS